MLSTTEGRGKFEGTRGFSLERDGDFPIRCTLQYYHVVERASDIKESHVEAIAAQVNELYDAAAPWNRGSLVTGGDTGRVTEHSSKIGFAESVGLGLPIRIWGFKI